MSGVVLALDEMLTSQAVGRVGCPPGQEANVDEFFFWVAPGALVEQTQIVRVDTRMAATEVIVYGVVEQVYRRSAITSMQMEVAAHNADPVTDDLILERAGVTYAKARVINTKPPVLAPPVEGSTVRLCSGDEAETAYEMDQYGAERGVCIGLIRNGGNATAGRAYLDQDFLLGAQAGHLNVNGAAGSGTKSSFLTIATYQTVNAIKALAQRKVGSGERPRVKAVIFNVKGFDLFSLDRWSKRFTDEDARIWREMGVDTPNIFRSIAYYAPERPGEGRIPEETGRPGDVRPYSWSLKDVVDFGLFELLFSDETRANENMVTLINMLVHRLSGPRRPSLMARLGVENGSASTEPESERARRQLTDSMETVFDPNNPLSVRTFGALLDEIQRRAAPEQDDLTDDALRQMSRSTIQAFWRRLARVLGPGSGLLRRDDVEGRPPLLVTGDEDVAVIDIQSIADHHLRRFAIAAVLNQLVQWRTGRLGGRHEYFLVVIDELNLYAPRGATDAITRLFEHVASQMRSRGIILFGAQQQGSRVSEVVIENSQTRVLGRSGGQELADPIWRGFSEGDRKLALRLGAGEKVIVAPNFREALHVRVPRPPWAMRPDEEMTEPPSFLSNAQPAGGARLARARVSDEGRDLQSMLDV
jgi:DNA helicase HerA-like ATPase